MTKTTVELDEKLLERARRAVGASTMRETLEAGLRSLVAHAEREKLRLELGTFDLALTPAGLRRDRRAR